LEHIEEPGRFSYRAITPKETVAPVELSRLISTFFGGSVTAAVSTLLDQERDRLTAKDIAELRKLIDRAEQEGR
jgi:predicted transcriptional regulator